ncbi:hypothetical protein BC941DRAFT_519652 [Chlamydoabsidia padenii]|nr:hypothetical protein BC941DRAFT_519652 [Chlamydoabsidia padenii]
MELVDTIVFILDMTDPPYFQFYKEFLETRPPKGSLAASVDWDVAIRTVKDYVLRQKERSSPGGVSSVNRRFRIQAYVGADGNCGFRAVSFGVYQDQTKWPTVKDEMLATYLKYQHTLYKAVGTDSVIQFEHQKMLRRLETKVSPCDDRSLWFSTIVCPQIVADTYQRPVMLYCYVENYLKTGAKKINYESQIYFPLVHMDLKNSNNPITLLASSHFYYVEFGRTPKGRMKKFNVPVTNMDNDRLRSSFPDICNSVDYSILF